MEKLIKELKKELLELTIKNKCHKSNIKNRNIKERIFLICNVLDKHKGHNELTETMQRNNQNTVDVMVSLYLELKKNKVDIPKNIQKECENIVSPKYLEAITKCVLKRY
jgi:GTP cyclohydrolase I